METVKEAENKNIEPAATTAAAAETQPKAGQDSSDTPSSGEPQKEKLRKTTGERYYDWMQFSLGKVWIIASSVALAYIARYGKDEYLIAGKKVPNYLRKMQEGFHNMLLNNKIFPMGNKGEFWKSFAGANASTFLTCHGGNFFAPMMIWLENNRKGISAYFNRHFGKSGEEEIGQERLKDLPKQTWGDIIKGRAGGWVIVMSSFLAAEQLIGKSKKLNRHYFDIYEDKFGRLMAGFTDKEIARIPVSKELTTAQKANKMYRFGRISALDFYATSAALILWTAISRSSARKRQNGQKSELEIIASESLPLPATSEMAVQNSDMKDDSKSSKLPSKHSPEKKPLTYVDAIESKRDASELATSAML